MAFPAPTKTYHTDTYSAIDPTLPALSTKGKNIVISGGGSGIGPEIAKAFAKSGASSIALLGRTEQTLQRTKQEIETAHGETAVYTYVADVVDSSALEKALTLHNNMVPSLDVLVANAGFLASITSVLDADADDWFQAYEVNVKGNFNLIRAFLPHATPTAAVLHISTGAAHIPQLEGHSGYATSKIAAAKLFEYLHYERPELFVLNIHPGVIRTAMNEKSAAKLAYDEVALPATFAVWAASDEAKFLNGKFVWAHWDVDELKAIASEIEKSGRFTLGLLGWA